MLAEFKLAKLLGFPTHQMSPSNDSLQIDHKSSTSIEETVVPVEDSKVEDFFKGVVEERPIIDVPGE